MNAPQFPSLLEFWLPASLDAVPSARRKAMGVCNEAGLTDNDCFELDLALGEALANAVKHGSPKGAVDQDKQQVYLGLWHHRKRLIIHIQDYGEGFTPPSPPYSMPEAAGHQTHGRGLPLMEVLTDAMAVCRGHVYEGGLSVFLIKRLPH